MSANCRADQMIKKGEFGKNQVLVETFERAKNGNGRLHLAVCFLLPYSWQYQR